MKLLILIDYFQEGVVIDHESNRHLIPLLWWDD